MINRDPLDTTELIGLVEGKGGDDVPHLQPPPRFSMWEGHVRNNYLLNSPFEIWIDVSAG